MTFKDVKLTALIIIAVMLGITITCIIGNALGIEEFQVMFS